MSSANGYKISIGGHELVASWPAPFFVLVPAQEPDEVPALIHCDDRAHADMHARCGGVLLDAKFERVSP